MGEKTHHSPVPVSSSRSCSIINQHGGDIFNKNINPAWRGAMSYQLQRQYITGTASSKQKDKVRTCHVNVSLRLGSVRFSKLCFTTASTGDLFSGSLFN